MTEEFWQNKIKAFLHDPPDKALILFHRSHEEERDKILNELGLRYDRSLNPADHISSAMQRLDIPKDYRMDDARNCNTHICFKGPNKPVFRHTVSSVLEELEEIKEIVATYGYEKALAKYCFNIEIVKEFLVKNDWKKTYFSLWRFLPEIYPLGYILPADTRVPDHSIWDHLDVTAAISSCLGDMGLFALKIPAVQEFISHSRKLSDLWASSHIFSLLLFEGVKEIIGEFGPDVVIYPQLRGNPLLDYYIKRGMGINITPDKDKIRIANLPNTFLCFIPLGKAEEYKEKCEKAVKRKWREISEKVKEYLAKINIKPNEKLWDFQIENALSVTVAYTKFFNIGNYEKVKDDLPNDVREKQDKWLGFVEKLERTNYGHFYFPSYALLGTTLAQSSRLWNAWEEEPITGKKCLMCGLGNALIERKDTNIYQYWKDDSWNEIKIEDKEWRNILKEGERLCAVCLIKRMYIKVFKEEFKAKPPAFES
ncbi:type III-B CRISPR-associated protein Cas10/Cmr2, partial [Candidatus Alkanophaga liquidiphilum]